MSVGGFADGTCYACYMVIGAYLVPVLHRAWNHSDGDQPQVLGTGYAVGVALYLALGVSPALRAIASEIVSTCSYALDETWFPNAMGYVSVCAVAAYIMNCARAYHTLYLLDNDVFPEASAPLSKDVSARWRRAEVLSRYLVVGAFVFLEWRLHPLGESGTNDVLAKWKVLGIAGCVLYGLLFAWAVVCFFGIPKTTWKEVADGRFSAWISLLILFACGLVLSIAVVLLAWTGAAPGKGHLVAISSTLMAGCSIGVVTMVACIPAYHGCIRAYRWLAVQGGH